jgi:hypothetical protein
MGFGFVRGRCPVAHAQAPRTAGSAFADLKNFLRRAAAAAA